MRRIVGIGAGGHAKSVLDAVLLLGEWEVVGLLDPSVPAGTPVLGRPVLGDDRLLAELRRSGVGHAFIGVGGVGDNAPRRAIYERLVAAGFELPSIVHPSAVVAGSARVGAGSVVLAQAVVNPDAEVGADVIINTAAVVEHDCRVGDHCHLGPRSALSAGVTVGPGTHVGVGAVVRQGISIGEGALVGAGAVVVKDVAAGARVAGVPARSLR